MKASGSLFHLLKRFISEKHNEDQDKILDSLDDSRDFFKGTIEKEKMHDIKHIQKVLQVLKDIYGDDEVIRLADFVAHAELNNRFWLVRRFISYETFLEKIPSYFKKIYETGTYEYEKIDEKSYILHMSEVSTTELNLQFISILLRRFAELISKRRFKESINKIDGSRTDFILVRNV